MILDKSRLPAPIAYYSEVFPTLSKGKRWALVTCPFHDDRTPSLSVNLSEGHFRCHACGAKGGDIIAFEMRRSGLSFKATLKRLGYDNE